MPRKFGVLGGGMLRHNPNSNTPNYGKSSRAKNVTGTNLGNGKACLNDRGETSGRCIPGTIKIPSGLRTIEQRRSPGQRMIPRTKVSSENTPPKKVRPTDSPRTNESQFPHYLRPNGGISRGRKLNKNEERIIGGHSHITSTERHTSLR